MARGFFALGFERFELALPGADPGTQLGFLALPVFYFLGLGGSREAERTEAGLIAPQEGLFAADLAVELAPGRVDHARGLRKRLGPLFHQPVKGVVFAHLFYEIFLS